MLYAQEKNIIISTSKIFTLLVLVITAGWLSYLNGKSTVTYAEDFDGLRSPISDATDINEEVVMSEVIENTSDQRLVMKRDRLYFKVFLDDIFTSAAFKLKFKNESQREFNLRVPVDKGVEDAPKYYLEKKDLDALKDSEEWIAKQELSSLLLLQRKDNSEFYQSVKDFLEHPVVTNDKEGTVALMGDFTFPEGTDITKTHIINIGDINTDGTPEEKYKDQSETGKKDKKATPKEKILFDYVIARYQPWIQDGEWKSNEYTVVVPETFRKKQVYLPFYLEAPGLEKEGNVIIIDSIEITLKKPNVTLRERLSSFVGGTQTITIK